VKKVLTILIISLACGLAAKAQKIDSIYFNLYTDSLKKGPLHYNYINVDGKLSNGRYIPLDSAQVRFTSSAGKMTGNVLKLDSTVKDEFVLITAALISNPAVRKEVKIYIKKVIATEPLKSAEELIDGWQKQGKKKN
jgi:hypothetical protein